MSVNHIKTIDTLMLNKKGLAASFLVGKKEFALIESGTHNNAEHTYQELLKIPYFDPKNVKYIITTHIHLDHSGGVSYLLEKFPNASIIHHYKTTRHLEDPSRLWDSSYQTNSYTASLYGKPDKIPSGRIIPARAGELIKVDDIELELIDAPGHHSYHYAILDRSSRTLFVGDSCGWYWEATKSIFPTTPPPRFDYQIYKQTIQAHMKLDPKNLAFTHFDILSQNTQEILWNSLDTATNWLEILKEYRSADKAITADQAVDKLIEDKYPGFENFEKGMKEVIFGISTLGIFNYLDSLESVSL